MEAYNQSYVRQNQQKLRASYYRYLLEMLGDSRRLEDEADVVRAERLSILPSSHVSGDRYMGQQMHEIIGTTKLICHPDYFIAIICNPRWPEITRSIFAGQIAQVRPDLPALLFRMKPRALMSMVLDENIFGNVVPNVRVIELQKRGLPHAHSIFLLDARSKRYLRNPLVAEEIINAHISPVQDAEL